MFYIILLLELYGDDNFLLRKQSDHFRTRFPKHISHIHPNSPLCFLELGTRLCENK